MATNYMDLGAAVVEMARKKYVAAQQIINISCDRNQTAQFQSKQKKINIGISGSFEHKAHLLYVVLCLSLNPKFFGY